MNAAQKQLAIFRPADLSDALTLLMMSFPGKQITFTAFHLFENQVTHYDIVVRGTWPWSRMKAIYTPTT